VTVRRPVVLFAAALLVAAVHVSWSAGVLPDRVASHFDAGGAADGWSSRAAFLQAYVGIVGLVALMMAGLAVLMPRLPAGALNVPDREYWLAPERAAASIRRVADWLLEFGAATVVFLVAVFHLSVRANLDAEVGPAEPTLGPAFGLMMVAFVVGSGAGVIRLLLAFRRPSGGGR